MSRKPKILCLHGYGGSGKILKEELDSRWPKAVTEKLDLVFLDAPFLDEGISTESREGEDYSSYENFNECIAYIEEHMNNCVPFDGVLGFSQGVILNTVPKIKSVIIMSGGKFGGEKYSAPELAKDAFSSPIDCLSVHFIGEMDYAKPYRLELNMISAPLLSDFRIICLAKRSQIFEQIPCIFEIDYFRKSDFKNLF